MQGPPTVSPWENTEDGAIRRYTHAPDRVAARVRLEEGLVRTKLEQLEGAVLVDPAWGPFAATLALIEARGQVDDGLVDRGILGAEPGDLGSADFEVLRALEREHASRGLLSLAPREGGALAPRLLGGVLLGQLVYDVRGKTPTLARPDQVANVARLSADLLDDLVELYYPSFPETDSEERACAEGKLGAPFFGPDGLLYWRNLRIDRGADEGYEVEVLHSAEPAPCPFCKVERAFVAGSLLGAAPGYEPNPLVWNRAVTHLEDCPAEWAVYLRIAGESWGQEGRRPGFNAGGESCAGSIAAANPLEVPDARDRATFLLLLDRHEEEWREAAIRASRSHPAWSPSASEEIRRDIALRPELAGIRGLWQWEDEERRMNAVRGVCWSLARHAAVKQARAMAGGDA